MRDRIESIKKVISNLTMARTSVDRAEATSYLDEVRNQLAKMLAEESKQVAKVSSGSTDFDVQLAKSKARENYFKMLRFTASTHNLDSFIKLLDHWSKFE